MALVGLSSDVGVNAICMAVPRKSALHENLYMSQCSCGFLKNEEFGLRHGHALCLEQQVAQVGVAPPSP